MSAIVVALFPIGPHGPTTQGGHVQDPTHPTRTLCDREVVDKQSTITNCRCSRCLYLMTQPSSTIPNPHEGATP